MPAPAALLTLVPWLPPAFPTGSFAAAHGLDAAIVPGGVTGPAGAETWIADVLAFGAGRTAAPLALPATRVLALYLQSLATMLTLAALRFLPMG